MPGRSKVLAILPILLAACGGEPGVTAYSDPFCQQVVPRVGAFIARERAAHPLPAGGRFGGTVVVGANSDVPDGMNSAVATASEAQDLQAFVNLMTLLQLDEDGRAHPYLAESWELGPDRRSITFHLRHDVFWHDGEPTDAHDVAFTYRVVTDPETGYPDPGRWASYDTSEGGVEVIDDFRVRIHLTPHVGFLGAWASLAILPEHLLGDVPHSELRQHPFGSTCPVGNGPFVLSSHVAQDRWTFAANPAFPEGLGGRPFVDRIVYRVIPEQTTLLTELLTGGIDVFIGPRSGQLDAIEADEHLSLRIPEANTVAVVIWNARRAQLSDRRVRRALTLATNRAEIAEVAFGPFATVANSSIPPAHWAFDPGIHEDVDPDPAQAERLLDTAGWIDRDGDGVREDVNGVPLSISLKFGAGNQALKDIAEIMQFQLSEVGVAVRPERIEYGVLGDQLTDPASRDFDGVVMGLANNYTGLYEDDLFHSRSIDQPFGMSGTNDPRIDELLDRVRGMTDRDEAVAVVSELQRELVEEAPYTFLFFLPRMVGVNDRLHGVPSGPPLFQSVRDWYLDEGAR